MMKRKRRRKRLRWWVAGMLGCFVKADSFPDPLAKMKRMKLETEDQLVKTFYSGRKCTEKDWVGLKV